MTLVVAASIVAMTFPSARAGDGFRAFQRRRLQASQQYQTSVETAFRTYQNNLKAAFAEYARKAAVVWGAKHALLPGRKMVVEYDDHMTERRIVDFKRGVARVEIALSPSEARKPAKVKRRLAKLVAQLVTQPADQRSIIAIARNPSGVRRGGQPLLLGVVANARGRLVTRENAAAFGRELAGHSVEHRQIGADGKLRIVLSAKFRLIPNYLFKLAMRYRRAVIQDAARQELDPRLVFAVIQTESFFNPVARSGAPAFGLMQLVPDSGARAAYRALYGRDRLVTDTYLYNPAHNLTLGTMYLHIIYFDYLDAIHNQKSRLWCAIAAYNTGVGNVLEAFAERPQNQSRRDAWRKTAFQRINSLTDGQVFRDLRRYLPYDETRQYLVKVRERMPKYGELL